MKTFPTVVRPGVRIMTGIMNDGFGGVGDDAGDVFFHHPFLAIAPPPSARVLSRMQLTLRTTNTSRRLVQAMPAWSVKT